MFNIENWKRHAILNLTGLATLQDGTVIVTPDGEDWTGKQVTLEDGTPLLPGEYVIAASRDSKEQILVIDKDGTVKEVRQASSKPVNFNPPKPQSPREKLEALEKRIKQMQDEVHGAKYVNPMESWLKKNIVRHGND